MSDVHAPSRTHSPPGEDHGRAGIRRVVVVPLLVLAVLATAVVTFIATSATLREKPPGTNSVAAGFARDMSIHHLQAVEMSFIIRERTDDERIRTLAYDIINTQATQRGMMLGWLDLWGLPTARSGAPMEWMSGWMRTHMDSMSGMGDTAATGGMGDGGAMGDMSSTGGDSALMPGMATEQQLDKLRHAHGRKAEVLFLQLMINHHHGGVMMARAAVDLAEEPDVRQLARKMVRLQRAEIELMTKMLHERGAQPLPWPMRRS